MLAFFFSSAQAENNWENNKEATFTVEGHGYPPIKASSVAQAHLMAKRAAIIDAYRNALASEGIQGYGEDIFYSGLSGFVRGLTIIEQEYLKDGGIRILVKVPAKNITVIPDSASKKTITEKPEDTHTGPLSVTVQEWYRIIKNLVRVEK